MNGIYMIKNMIDGQSYVGSSSCVYDRLKSHVTFLVSKTHINKSLQESWNTHGGTAFVFSVLEVVPEDQDLGEREIHWIRKMGAQSDGFNTKTDQYASRSLMSVGSDVHVELEELHMGSMNRTLKVLVDFYRQKHRD